MAAIEQRLIDDCKNALKAGDAASLATLRMLLAAVKNESIALRHPLEDAETTAVLQREVKRRRDAAAMYRKAGENERAAHEEAEVAIVQRYLPAQMSAEEVTAAVDRILASAGASGPADMGKVMGKVMAELKGKADGTVVRAAVEARLKATP